MFSNLIQIIIIITLQRNFHIHYCAGWEKYFFLMALKNRNTKRTRWLNSEETFASKMDMKYIAFNTIILKTKHRSRSRLFSKTLSFLCGLKYIERTGLLKTILL